MTNTNFTKETATSNNFNSTNPRRKRYKDRVRFNSNTPYGGKDRSQNPTNYTKS